MNQRFLLMLFFLFAPILPREFYKSPVALLEAEHNHNEQAATAAINWWDVNWGYRVPITVDAAGYARSDKPVDVTINFADMLSELGVSGTLNKDSLYLHEVDGAGVIINANVPFQYDPPPGSTLTGRLTILMTGVTAAYAKRHYHLYFDVEAAGPFAPQTVTPLVSITNNVVDAGKVSYKIQTNAATYYYHKEGGGFSRMVDKDGHDWISYSTDTGSAGDFRGIPNMVYPADGGYFHPGRTGVVSTILSQGPLKVVIHSQTADKSWENRWEIFPDYARLTMVKAATNYWFLYEGTPGGVLDNDTDFIMRPDGTKTMVGTPWAEDLSPEWLYFSDSSVGRSLYFAHHEDDSAVDSYYSMDGEMTVFGFGREGVSRFLSQVPSHFTLGLRDGVEIEAIRSAIQSAYEGVIVTVGEPESQLLYSLVITKQGKGQVTIDPDKSEYLYSEEIVLEAIPDPGWKFKEWTGDLVGENPNPTIVIKNNMQITAVFEQEQYTLTIQKTGNGTITKSPDKEYYLYGEEVLLEATPIAGWFFEKWGGGISGDDKKVSLTITDNHTVHAYFKERKYYLPAILTG